MVMTSGPNVDHAFFAAGTRSLVMTCHTVVRAATTGWKLNPVMNLRPQVNADEMPADTRLPNWVNVGDPSHVATACAPCDTTPKNGLNAPARACVRLSEMFDMAPENVC